MRSAGSPRAWQRRGRSSSSDSGVVRAHGHAVGEPELQRLVAPESEDIEVTSIWEIPSAAATGEVLGAVGELVAEPHQPLFASAQGEGPEGNRAHPSVVTGGDKVTRQLSHATRMGCSVEAGDVDRHLAVVAHHERVANWPPRVQTQRCSAAPPAWTSSAEVADPVAKGERLLVCRARPPPPS